MHTGLLGSGKLTSVVCIVIGLVFDGRFQPETVHKPAGVVPVNPVGGEVLDIMHRAQRPDPERRVLPDRLSLVKPNYCLRQRIIVSIPDRADRRLHPGKHDRLPAVHRGVLRPGIGAGWLSWAKHSRIPEFVKVAATIDRYRQPLLNTLDHGLSNARSEATNTHLRALTKRAYGFHSPEAMIAMAMLSRGGLCPALPGRAA